MEDLLQTAQQTISQLEAEAAQRQTNANLQASAQAVQRAEAAEAKAAALEREAEDLGRQLGVLQVGVHTVPLPSLCLRVSVYNWRVSACDVLADITDT